MATYYNGLIGILADVVSFLCDPDYYYFSALLYILFVCAVVVILYNILRGRF